MSLYAPRLAPGSTLLEDAETVSESRDGWAFLWEAVTLWRLVNPAHAEAIERFVSQVADANEPCTQFAGGDLATLIEMLKGLEEAIRAAGIIDEDGRVAPERLEELKRQVPAMDVASERSQENRRYALLEVILHAQFLRMFLSKAYSAGCIVVHD